MAKKQLTTKAALVYIICVSMLFTFFCWTPDTLAGQWLRCLFLYIGGFGAILYLCLYKTKLALSRYIYILLGSFLLFSLIGLSQGSSLTDTLFGRPLSHASLLSLIASVALGLLFAVYKKESDLFRYIYYVIFGFSCANLFYYAGFARGRLGAFGLQINYTAHILILGIIIGNWLLQKQRKKSKGMISMQYFMMFCVVLTLSRTALLFIIPLFCHLLYILWQSSYKKIALCSAIGMLLVTGLFISWRGHRLTNSSYQKESFSYRYDLIQAARPNSPSTLLLGKGIGSIERNINIQGQKYPLIAIDLRSSILFESSHNYFVDIVVERGLISLFLFCTLIIIAIRNGLNSRHKEDKLLLTILVVSLLFMMVNNIDIQQELVIFSCLIGLLAKTPKAKQLT